MMSANIKLGEVTNIITGKLDANAVEENGIYPFFTCASIPSKINSFAFDDDVILIAGNNAAGNFHLNRYKGKFNAYQRTYILTAKDDSNLDYIYYSLKLELDRLKKNSQGSQTKFLTMPILTNLAIKNVTILKQQKIAAILAALDAKIELNNRINAELEAMAKTLYDYWFVQFDFPNAEGKPYKTSGGAMVWNEELKREIPEGWSVGGLDSLFEFNPTLSIKKGVASSYIDMDALPVKGYMTKEVKRKEFNGGVKFKNGDVVVARITPCLENGKTGLITLLGKDEVGFGSTEFIVIRGKKSQLSGFASLLARSELFRKYAITNMTGTSGRKRVEADVLRKYQIAIPEKHILQEFEKITTSVFQQTTVNVRENQQLSSLRDWLLPMLMNGQVVVE